MMIIEIVDNNPPLSKPDNYEELFHKNLSVLEDIFYPETDKNDDLPEEFQNWFCTNFLIKQFNEMDLAKFVANVFHKNWRYLIQEQFEDYMHDAVNECADWVSYRDRTVVYKK